MKRLISGWFFYASVLVFLAAAALTLPQRCAGTVEAMDKAAARSLSALSQRAEALWQEYRP